MAYERDDEIYHHLKLDVAQDGRSLDSVSLIEKDMETIPEEIRDEKFAADVLALLLLLIMLVVRGLKVNEIHVMPAWWSTFLGQP